MRQTTDGQRPLPSPQDRFLHTSSRSRAYATTNLSRYSPRRVRRDPDLIHEVLANYGRSVSQVPTQGLVLSDDTFMLAAAITSRPVAIPKYHRPRWWSGISANARESLRLHAANWDTLAFVIFELKQAGEAGKSALLCIPWIEYSKLRMIPRSNGGDHIVFERDECGRWLLVGIEGSRTDVTSYIVDEYLPFGN